jgi:hypothetical protein
MVALPDPIAEFDHDDGPLSAAGDPRGQTCRAGTDDQKIRSQSDGRNLSDRPAEMGRTPNRILTVFLAGSNGGVVK